MLKQYYKMYTKSKKVLVSKLIKNSHWSEAQSHKELEDYNPPESSSQKGTFFKCFKGPACADF